MKVDKDILSRVDRHDGMTVPDGYFADFAARMASSLETTDFETSKSLRFKPAPTSMWHRVRPYVYLAAMFAGVWCMLKMFTMIYGGGGDLEISPTLAEALYNDKFVDTYIIDEIDPSDIYDMLIEEGCTFEDFGIDDADGAFAPDIDQDMIPSDNPETAIP